MNKKVFISYSWGNKEHQNWVTDLGTRLMDDTVEVILDRWSLKDGHDIHGFMEEMVSAEDIFRVLVLCDKNYKEKADSREGGVGTETQIITPNIYTNQKQEKFIPIVLERDEDQKPYLPIYLANRKYIDFSQEEMYEDSYEELLRNILEAPALPKPKLGTKPPAYITESSVNLSKANSKLRTLGNKIKKDSTVGVNYLNDFIDTFNEQLWDFQLNYEGRDINGYGDALLEQYKMYKPLREDFIQFTSLITTPGVIENGDILIEFFENSNRYSRPKDENEQGWRPTDFSIFKLIFHELFIYTIAICVKNKSYGIVADLLHSRYYKKDIYSNKKEPEIFTFLYEYHEYLESYMKQNYNKITGFGDTLISNLSPLVSKENIILADMICYVVSYLETENTYERWFPNTYLYLNPKQLIFFDKTTSKRHFEQIKEIFNVQDQEELKSKLNTIKEKSTERLTFRSRFDEIPFVHELINPDKIAIYR